MPKFPLAAAALSAVLFTSIPASAQWTKIDDFQGHTTGQPVSSNGNWITSGSSSYPVIADPGNPANRFLSVVNSTNAVIRLNQAANSDIHVPNGTTATLFVRFRFEGVINYSFGLSDVSTASGFTNYESQYAHNTPENSASVRDGGSFRPLAPASPLVPGVWYSLWMVVNNTTDTTTLYIDSTTAPGQSTSAIQSFGEKTAFSFRNGTASNALNALVILTSSGTPQAHTGTLHLDDIYINHSGQNLGSPLATDAIQVHANDDLIEIPIQGSISFDPLANDSTTFGTLDPATLILIDPPSAGTAQINPTTHQVLYEHTGDSAGSDQFTYQITTSLGVSAQAAVNVTIVSDLRVANTTLTLPAEPPAGGPLQVVDALPGLTFPGAVGMATVPGNPKALLVASIAGNVWMVPDTTAPNPARYELFNVASLSNFTRGRSIYGITCHPDFATNGHIIINYQGDLSGLPPIDEIPNISNLPISEKTGRIVECTLRISRFTVSAADRSILLNPSSTSTQLSNTKAAVLATEHRYLNIAEEHVYHSINDCKFGPDGYLYVSFGDEGSQGEPYRNAQFITKDQFSSIVRIDIDRRPENLEPNPHYAIVTDGGVARFKIPADNPYVGPDPVYNGQPIPAADIPKVRTEIWATGFRNPFKFEIDPPTGELWVGDVGMSRWEEVSIINAGDNAGWSYWEGNEQRSDISHAIPPSDHKTPEHAYSHNSGNNSVTGGVFYRGSAYSSLQNKYVFGDYGSGRIWALTLGTETVPTAVVELPVGGVSSVVDFEVDPFTGEILILQHGSGRRVMRLVEGSGTAGFPQLLSQTGAFADLASLQPNPGVIPYQPNLTFWSDHAEKSRFFAIKNLTDQVTYSRDGNWSYPEGMVFIKHFDIDLNRDAPGTETKRLETRFLVRSPGGSYGVSYRWNEEGTDASLVDIGGVEFDLEITEGGAAHTQRWRVPSRGECLTCHTPSAGHALSFNTLQLNRDGTLTNVEGNFLTLLSDSGYLSGFSDDPATLGRHHRPDETDADLEARVRSYLAVNCSYCHHPGSGVGTAWDARAHVPLAEAGILYGKLISQAYHDPDDFAATPGQTARSAILTRIKARDAIGDGRFNGYSQMPPLASNVVDDAGVALMEEWLLNHANLAPAFTAGSPGSVQESDAAPLGTVIGTLASLDPDVREAAADQSLVRYGITAGNDNSLFSLDPVSGVLRVNGMLHYGRQSTHLLTITATDQFAPNPGITTHSVSIDLTDAGDKDLDGNGLPDFWETGYSLAGAGAADDTDADGIKDYFEFVSGGDPTAPDHGATLPEIQESTTPRSLVLTWRHRNGLVFGNDYRLQSSEDLKIWKDMTPAADFEVISNVQDGPGFSRLTIRTLGDPERNFVRLSDTPSSISLFNGQTLDGWVIRQGSLAMYQVIPADGSDPAYLEGTADGSLGMLATAESYDNFDLRYDFWVEDPLNSGVQIRSYFGGGQVRGYQVEIDPSTRAWSAGLYEQSTGRNWLATLENNPDARAAFISGGWNQVRVLAEGTRIRTWINGVPAVDYTETDGNTPSSGFIALQVHQGGSSIIGKRVRFRNMRVSSL